MQPTKELGTLRLVETYVYHDRPLLFSVVNDGGAFYLVVLWDERSDGDTWLLVGLSEARLKRVRVGEVDLHDAFRQPEDGLAYLLTEHDAYWVALKAGDALALASAMPTVQVLAAAELDPARLPDPGERLERRDEPPRFDGDTEPTSQLLG